MITSTAPANLKEYFDYLINNRSKIINTKEIKDLMQTLDSKYKRGNNSIYWYQLFANGGFLERAFTACNEDILHYCNNDHYRIGDKARGDYVPDFYFIKNGVKYTLDTKTYLSRSGFDGEITSKFEGANYVVAFIIEENKYYVRCMVNNNKYSYTRAIEYSKLDEFTLRILNDIEFPQTILMINFGVSRLNCDESVPDQIPYTVKEYYPEI